MSGRAAVGVGETDAPPGHRLGEPEDASLDRLYRAQRQKLLRFLSRRTNSDRAEDLVQQTFARFADLSAERQLAINCPEAYLYRTASNLVCDEAKSARRKGLNLHFVDDGTTLLASDQVAALEARDMLRRVETAALKMRRLTREIFMAHRLDGYTYAEIAEQTGLSVKGVEKHMGRALAHLDRALRAR